MDNMIIETIDLTKIYGNKIGCNKICLSVDEGQIFGFLGPNGAGKSTFIKMLIGLIYPTSGEARLFGEPVGNVAARRRIGFLPENFRYQDWLTGRELLNFHAALAGVPKSDRSARIKTVLKQVKLSSDAADAKIRTYSKGMQQRAGIAAALIADPDLLFLDEPTSALDPIGRMEVREIIADLKDRGKAVFLNSHLLGEVEMVCDKVAIIKAGNIVESGSMDELLKGKIEVEVKATGLDSRFADRLNGHGNIIEQEESRYLIEMNDEGKIPDLAALVIASGGKLYGLTQRKRSLEELFISTITGSTANSVTSGITTDGTLVGGERRF
jgi:ABC-2 type transport system ATP-binding protein